MKNKILNNWPYKLLAVLVAFVTWFIVVQIADPQVTARFSVPVTFINEEVILESGQAVTKYDADTVTIRITKPRSVIAKLSSDSFYAEADFNQMYRDTQVPVTVTSLSSEVSNSDIEVEKQSIGVTVEKLVNIEKVVETESKGEPAAGYAVGTITPSPTSIEITCPESYASTIETVKAVTDVSGISEAADIKSEIKLFNAKGEAIEVEKIPGFSLNGNEIITCHVELMQVQSLPIKVLVADESEVASGYVYTGATTSLENISITGDKDTLAKIKEVVIDNLSVSGLNETTTKEVDVRSYLPTDVKIKGDTTTIKVTLNIVKASEKKFEISADDIKIENLTDGFKARIDEGATVTIASSEEKLSALSSADITATVDLSSLKAGTHSVTLNISFKEDGYTLKENAQVKVVISR